MELWFFVYVQSIDRPISGSPERMLKLGPANIIQESLTAKAVSKQKMPYMSSLNILGVYVTSTLAGDLFGMKLLKGAHEVRLKLYQSRFWAHRDSRKYEQNLCLWFCRYIESACEHACVCATVCATRSACVCVWVRVRMRVREQEWETKRGWPKKVLWHWDQILTKVFLCRQEKIENWRWAWKEKNENRSFSRTWHLRPMVHFYHEERTK